MQISINSKHSNKQHLLYIHQCIITMYIKEHYKYSKQHVLKIIINNRNSRATSFENYNKHQQWSNIFWKLLPTATIKQHLLKIITNSNNQATSSEHSNLYTVTIKQILLNNQPYMYTETFVQKVFYTSLFMFPVSEGESLDTHVDTTYTNHSIRNNMHLLTGFKGNVRFVRPENWNKAFDRKQPFG